MVSVDFKNSQEDLILKICKGGRYFEDVPFFDKYRYIPKKLPDVDYSSAGGDILQEMLKETSVSKRDSE